LRSFHENGSGSMSEPLKVNGAGELGKTGDKPAYHDNDGQKLEASKRHT